MRAYVALVCEECGCTGALVDGFNIFIPEYEDEEPSITFWAQCPYCKHGKTLSLKTVVEMATVEADA